MQQLTVPFVVYEVTDSKAWLSVAVAASYLPQFFVSPLAGAAADRLSRRGVLVWSQVAQMVTSVALALLWIADVDSVGPMLVIVVVSNLAAGFHIICWQAIVPALVPAADLTSAIRLNSLQFMLGRAVGPAIAGFVLARFGPGVAFSVNGLSFVGVVVVLLSLKVTEAPARRAATVRNDLADGLRFVRSHPVTRHAMVSAAMVTMFGYAVVQLAPAIAVEGFGVEESGYAALLVGHGVGSLIATGGLTVWGNRFLRSRVTIVGLVAGGVGSVVVGTTGWLLAGIVGFVFIGLGQSMVSVSQNTALQLQVEDGYRGRVLSLYIMGIIGAVPVGSLLLTTLASEAGIGAGPIVAGVVLAGYAAYAVRRFGGLRGLDADVPLRSAG